MLFDVRHMYIATAFHRIRICFAYKTLSMDISAQYNRRSPETTEAWTLGSGTTSLASAVYQIKKGSFKSLCCAYSR